MEEPGGTPSRRTMSDWGVLFAMITSILTASFTAGVVWKDVQSHDRRIVQLEQSDNKTTDALASMSSKMAGMDAKIDFLVEQAREDRARK